MKRLALAFALAAAPAAAQTPADRSHPPQPEPPRPLNLPPVQRAALGNSLPVYLAERHKVPIVEVPLLFARVFADFFRAA